MAMVPILKKSSLKSIIQNIFSFKSLLVAQISLKSINIGVLEPIRSNSLVSITPKSLT